MLTGMNAWGNPPTGEAWRETYELQEPDIYPRGDPLIEFVHQRIIAAESEPRSEMPMLRDQPAGAAAERYALEVRKDMKAFRVIVATLLAGPSAENFGLYRAVQIIAERWSTHPDYRPEWSAL
jgi:hypothetical protein